MIDSRVMVLPKAYTQCLTLRSDKASCSEVKEIATHHLQDIRAKISDLAKLKRLLTKTISRCSGHRVPDCPVLDILDIQRPK